MTSPKENRTQTALMLVEQFRRKGYSCRELKETDATILILTHEKKQRALSEIPVMITGAKNFMGAN